jgi:thiol-disulfide isomerase/thioredoxin
MRKLSPFVIIGILVLSGLGASAITIEEENNENNNYYNSERATHTVLAEYGTATWCGFCKYAHGALKELYSEGQLDFYYVTLVCDENSIAYSRAKTDYNLYGYPTVWWDGGYKVNIGAGSVPAAKTAYTSSINNCGARTVKDVDINLDVSWLGGTKMKVECEVINNEANTYEGHIRVYIVEKESSMGWTDTAGDLYTMAFLDWAFNEPLSISSGGSWSDSMNWNGLLNGFPSVTKPNIMVIAAVFNDEWYQGYSYTPPQNPFDAYYVDETVGVVPGTNNANKEIYRPFLNFLQNYPNMFPILQILLQRLGLQ